ncbi:esterase-like activity of phytase family protein [Sphingomonas sp.]|uniref:esterase-like activity of phytase family protein n=1 Tax=Sphingomonas sp. TaxID=28214 RepID=UPI0035BC6147
MRACVVVCSVVLFVLGIVPGWSGETRLPLLDVRAQMDATRVDLDPRSPQRRRVGQLLFLGGVALTSRDPAFGGFSALAVDGDRFTLLSDGGNVVRFRMGADWRPHALVFSNLPAGPGTGWDKRDRDSESLAVDPATGRLWVGFENSDAIWRYAPGFARAEAQVVPPAMAAWPNNGGPESLARLPGGRFVAIGEVPHVPPRAWAGSEAARLHTRDARVFFGDPTAPGLRQARFAYVPFGRYDPADAAALPNGDLLVLDRRFALPFHWSNRLSVVPAATIGAGRVARGRLIATLDAPLIHDNFEGVAVTREGADTILWLVSDDNQLPIQRSLLLKFRLETRMPKARSPR